MRLFRNRFFLICLCVALVLAILPTTLSFLGYRALVRDAVGVVSTPFRWVGTLFVNAAQGFGRYFGSVASLRSEADSLREENDSLRARLDRAELLERENSRLRAYLGMKQSYPGFTFEDASVIGREASNYITVFTLDRGSIHGIAVNMPVVTSDGIVGCVSEVGLTWCRVSTILETANSVGAYLPRTEANGIISGDYSMKTVGLCKLSYLDPSDADLAVGDTVLSSGIGSVYPAGLVIGTVEGLESDPSSRGVIARVRPAVSYSELKNMMILTGYESAPPA